MNYENMTEQDEERVGLQFIEVFGLKEAKLGRSSYNPKRYVTQWGNKTAIGVARTAYGIMKQHWK